MKSLMRNKFNLSNDIMFKRMFNNDSKVCRNILRHWLRVFLNMEITSIEFLNPEVSNGMSEDKQYRADVFMRVNDRHLVIIEMQANKRKDDKARFVSYEGMLTLFRHYRGEPYDYGMNVILTFLDHHIRGDKQPADTDYICHRYHDGEIYSQKYMIQPVELVGLKPLLSKPLEEISKRERYKLFLKYSHNARYKEKLDEIIQAEEGLIVTNNELREIMGKPDFIHQMIEIMHENEELQEQRRLEKKKENERKRVEREERSIARLAAKNQEKLRKFEEDTRKANEKARKFEEDTRKAIENARKFEEDTRKANEKARKIEEDARKTEVAIREAATKEIRKAEEDARKAKEDARIEKEKSGNMIRILINEYKEKGYSDEFISEKFELTMDEVIALYGRNKSL